jgi:hypothetical protein
MRLKLLAWGERGKSERDIDVPKLRTLPILSYRPYTIALLPTPSASGWWGKRRRSERHVDEGGFAFSIKMRTGKKYVHSLRR